MTQSFDPTLALIDSNIRELQQLILEFEALTFPPIAPSPSDGPPKASFRIKMKAGKGYNALAKQIHRRMKDHPDWQEISGKELRQRMGGQMLFKDHVYQFEPAQLLSDAPISGGLDPKI